MDTEDADILALIVVDLEGKFHLRECGETGHSELHRVCDPMEQYDMLLILPVLQIHCLFGIKQLVSFV